MGDLRIDKLLEETRLLDIKTQSFMFYFKLNQLLSSLVFLSMKIIPVTRRTDYIWYLGFYYYHRVDTSAGGLFVSEEYHTPSSHHFGTDI